ncbi:MAG: hypothetical protein HKN87_06455 [Saprospiraceae bacterium]|nr:hypothetical protein [Saprospiraceae bacterium]
MQNSRKISIITSLLLAMVVTCFGQDKSTAVQQVVISVPEVALIDLESATGTTIEFSPEVSSEAGEAIDFSNQRHSGIWINYSSIVSSRTEPGRNITAQITSGRLPQGVELSVVASQDAGQGEGAMGKATTAINLTNQSQDIIRGVGSAYTGNGVSKGHELTYALSLSESAGSYASLDFNESGSVSITYTMTDQ